MTLHRTASTSSLFVALTAILLWACPLSAQETRLFRVRFVGASFSFRTDTFSNSNLGYISGSSGYDAVWEARVPASVPFPTSFGRPFMRNVKGRTKYTVKNPSLGGQCEAELQFNPDPATHPSVNVYHLGETRYAIKIAAAHSLGRALSNSNAPAPCGNIYSVFFAPGESVTESFSPGTAGLPSDPNTPGLPPSPTEFAAFEVDLRRPETTVNFQYVQNANLVGGQERAKTVWFGFVNVEVDPARNDRTPPPIDPFSLYGYSPSSPDQPPSDPPDPSNPTPPAGRGLIVEWLGGTIVDQIQQALQSLRAALGGKARRSRLPAESYDPASGVLTLTDLSACPADGSLSVKAILGKADSPAKRLAKGVAYTAGSTAPLTLTLPPSLRKAIAKKGKTKVRIVAEFKPRSGKLVTKRGSLTLQ